MCSIVFASDFFDVYFLLRELFNIFQALTHFCHVRFWRVISAPRSCVEISSSIRFLRRTVASRWLVFDLRLASGLLQLSRFNFICPSCFAKPDQLCKISQTSRSLTSIYFLALPPPPPLEVFYCNCKLRWLLRCRGSAVRISSTVFLHLHFDLLLVCVLPAQRGVFKVL